MPKLIISNEDKQDFLLGQINSEQLIAAAIDEGFVDQQQIRSIYNVMATAMFSAWRLLELPDELFDLICKGDTKGRDEFLAYVFAKEKSAFTSEQISDKEKALISILCGWVTGTVGMGYVLGTAFQRDVESQGKEAPVKEV